MEVDQVNEAKNIGDEAADRKTEQGWQPMATVPRDDSAFLAYCHGSGRIYQVFRYAGDDRYRIYASGGRILYEPLTHWMPLPSPPDPPEVN